MKRIAFLTSDLSYIGGTQAVVNLLSSSFVDKLNYKVYIYTLSQSNGEIKYKLNPNVVIVNLGIDFNLKYFFKFIWNVNRLNKIHKIDTILGIGCYLNVFLPLFLNVKKIACEHNSYDITSKRTAFVRKLSYRFVDYVVSLTQEDLPKYLKINSKSICIPNPIIYCEISNSSSKKDIVISAGALENRKGFDRLLYTWKLIENVNKDCTLQIYGDGEEKSNLENLIKQLGLVNAKLMGSTFELPEKLKKSKVFVLTSRKEGFPMVILEAMNYGLPVVSFNIKTGPNEIIKNGIDGYLLEDDDLEGLSQKILFLLSNDAVYTEMSLNAKKNVKRFAVDNLIPKWASIL